MNCPFCKSHSRTIRSTSYEEFEWCYGCGAMFKVIMVKPQDNTKNMPKSAVVDTSGVLPVITIEV